MTPTRDPDDAKMLKGNKARNINCYLPYCHFCLKNAI